MGFTSAESLSREAWALWERIDAGDALTTEEWRQVLLAVEIMFVSDVVGSGLDFRMRSGIPDDEAIKILRGLQRRLPRWRGSVQFSTASGRVEIVDQDRPDA